MSFFLVAPSLLFIIAASGSNFQIASFQSAGFDVCALIKCTLTNTNFVVGAQGSWVVPSIKSCAANELSTISYEVGIDYSPDNFDVRNGAGIDLNCANGATSYSAFVIAADVPVPLNTIKYAVHPGDHLSAKVAYNRVTASFTLMLHDATHMWTYKPMSYKDGSALLNQGLFVLGRPCTMSSCPIPHFGTLKTSGDYVTINSGGLTGTKGSLGFWLKSPTGGSPSGEILRFEMTDSDTGNVLASTNSITTASSAFSITFKNPS